MGSKISKAVRRPAAAADKAAVTQTPTPTRQTTSTPGTDPCDSAHASRGVNTGREAPRQETSLPFMNNVLPRVAITFDGESAATAATSTSQPNTDFDTTETSADTMDAAARRVDPGVLERARARAVEEVDRMTQDVALNTTLGGLQPGVGQPAVPTAVEQSNGDEATATATATPREERIQCIVCCEEYPKTDEHKIIIYPCRPCGSAFCGNCLTKMFTDATEKTSKMPPRCCGQLQLHVARPFLTKEQAAAFRTKYDEWSTQNPFYCPVPTCSVFIPNRLLPRMTKKLDAKPASHSCEAVEEKEKGKARVDSVIGTPESPLIDCPSCKTSICTQCRQLAHPSVLCSKLEFGQIDEATAELLKGWGYKRCPKCGNGVRRMFGCNHMECLCGAHWCWVCQLPRDECDGGCYEDEDGDSDVEDFDDDDEEPVPETPLAEGESIESRGVVSAEGPGAPQPPRRERNLDAGSRVHWEDAGLNFGDEPSDEIQDRAWECRHYFSTAKTPASESLVQAPTTTNMECSRCWNTVYPEVEFPSKVGNGVRMASGYSMRYGFGRGQLNTARGRAQALRGGFGRGGVRPPPLPPGFVPPGFARFLPPPAWLAANDPSRATSDSAIDAYGNTITEVEVDTQSIRSLEIPRMSDTEFDEQLAVYSSSVPTTGFDKIMLGKGTVSAKLTEGDGPFSFAYECSSCGVLVCEKCKKDLIDEQEAIDEAARTSVEGMP